MKTNYGDLTMTNTGDLMAELMGSTDDKHWIWVPLWNTYQHLRRDDELIGYLTSQAGWAHSPYNRELILESQLYDVITLTKDEKRFDAETAAFLYRSGEERRVPVPVILAISSANVERYHLKHKPGEKEGVIPLLSPFPLPETGEYAYVVIGEGANERIVGYDITQLPAAAQKRHAQLGETLRTLAGPLGWTQYAIAHAVIRLPMQTGSPLREMYGPMLAERQRLVEQAAPPEQREQFTRARQQIDLLNDLIQSPWQDGWLEAQRLVRDLARDYLTYHQDITQEKPEKQTMSTYPLPPLTSDHRSILPSIDHFRGLAQSFGPRVAMSLWNTAESSEQLLEAPNGARLAVRGENDTEKKALYELVQGGMGVEGIKYMISLMAIYYEQTNAADRKTDARVSLRQILSYMGRGDHADDLDEQRKVMHYILYLARTWVTALDKPQEVVKKRGRPPRIYVEYTPLIVLEALGSDERGGIKIPAQVEFHLGKEFWDQMFARHQHFFTMPTALILGYHSKDQPQEICLSVYLANMLNLNLGTFAIHFPVLLVQTGLQDQQDIDLGHDRTRAAMRVLYALERLEIDLLITREAHPDIDMALAVEFFEGKLAKEKLAERTLKRLEESYSYVTTLSAAARRTHKRVALQNLLERVNNNSIKFRSGPLINTQIQKRIAGRQAAIESRERAQEAEQRRTRKRRKLQ